MLQFKDRNSLKISDVDAIGSCNFDQNDRNTFMYYAYANDGNPNATMNYSYLKGNDWTINRLCEFHDVFSSLMNSVHSIEKLGSLKMEATWYDVVCHFVHHLKNEFSKAFVIFFMKILQMFIERLGIWLSKKFSTHEIMHQFIFPL